MRVPTTACALTLLGVVSFLSPGCFSNQGVRSSATTPRVPSSAIVSPLSVLVSDPAALASVNALLLSAPSLSTEARSVRLDPEMFQGLIEDAANRELDLRVYGSEWSQRNQISGTVLTGESPEQRLALQKAGVDAVLKTELTHYSDRVGSALGGEPAAVGFRMTVTRLVDGKELWQGTYYLKQQALSDNFLKIGEKFGNQGTGAGWTSGVELLKRGAALALQDFRLRRLSAFEQPTPGR